MAVAAVSIASSQGYIPPASVAAIASGALCLAFLPQLHALATRLLARRGGGEEEEAEESWTWVNDNLSKMRSLYSSARFLIKVQDQTRDSLPDYGLPGMDEALFSRETYFREALPSEFLSVIGRIMVFCDRNVWERRSLLISAMAASRSREAAGG